MDHCDVRGPAAVYVREAPGEEGAGGPILDACYPRLATVEEFTMAGMTVRFVAEDHGQAAAAKSPRTSLPSAELLPAQKQAVIYARVSTEEQVKGYAGEFPKEMLVERRARLEETLQHLTREQAELSTHLRSLLITDEQIAELEAFCAEVREGLDEATFEDKRRYFELLDLRGTLVVENGEKVVYVQCKLASPQRLEIRTSHLSSTGGRAFLS